MVKTRLVESSHTVMKQTPAPGSGHHPPEFTKMFNDLRVRAGEPCKIQVTINANPKPQVSNTPNYMWAILSNVYSALKTILQYFLEASTVSRISGKMFSLYWYYRLWTYGHIIIVTTITNTSFRPKLEYWLKILTRIDVKMDDITR